MKQRTPPTYFYVPFERVERRDDGCYVEGYAFVNEAVRGDRAVIRRRAMEAATAEYMRFANIREMHGKVAAGIATEAIWDTKGCLMRAKIVDPVARLKCEEGVYKGFSIGVQPLVMRGVDVEKLDWIETSLVDRPKDPDALFTAFRADALDPEGAECEQLEDGDAPADTRSVEPAPEPTAGLAPQPEPQGSGEPAADPVTDAERVDEPAADAAGVEDAPAVAEPEGERGMDAGSAPHRENLEPKCPRCGTMCRMCRPERADEPAPDVTPDPAIAPETPESAEISRLEALEAENTALATDKSSYLARAETAEAEIARVQGELSTRDGELAQAKERITVLERTPGPRTAPVRYPDAFQREFFVNRATGRAADVAALATEMEALSKSRPKDADEQNRVVARINELKMQIANLL